MEIKKAVKPKTTLKKGSKKGVPKPKKKKEKLPSSKSNSGLPPHSDVAARAIKELKKTDVYSNLKINHKIFVLEYISNLENGTLAYMKAFPNVSYNVAGAAAPRLLADVRIQAAIAECYKTYWKEKDSDIEKAKTLLLIKAISETTLYDVVSIDGDGEIIIKDESELTSKAKLAVNSITVTKSNSDSSGAMSQSSSESKSVSVRMENKLKALELRAKIQGLFVEKEASEINIVIKGAQRPDREPIEVESKINYEEDNQNVENDGGEN